MNMFDVYSRKILNYIFIIYFREFDSKNKKYILYLAGVSCAHLYVLMISDIFHFVTNSLRFTANIFDTCNPTGSKRMHNQELVKWIKCHSSTPAFIQPQKCILFSFAWEAFSELQTWTWLFFSWKWSKKSIFRCCVIWTFQKILNWMRPTLKILNFQPPQLDHSITTEQPQPIKVAQACFWMYFSIYYSKKSEKSYIQGWES